MVLCELRTFWGLTPYLAASEELVSCLGWRGLGLGEPPTPSRSGGLTGNKECLCCVGACTEAVCEGRCTDRATRSCLLQALKQLRFALSGAGVPVFLSELPTEFWALPPHAPRVCVCVCLSLSLPFSLVFVLVWREGFSV